jgi:hypothetical protein
MRQAAKPNLMEITLWGNLIFTDTNYAIQILKANRPKIVANDKDKATPEEYKALVQGNNSHFGTYILDQDKKKLHLILNMLFIPIGKDTTNQVCLLDHDTLTYRSNQYHQWRFNISHCKVEKIQIEKCHLSV